MKILILIAVLMISGCKGGSNSVNNDDSFNENERLLAGEIFAPDNINGLIYRIKVTESKGFFPSHQSYNLNFYRNQNFYQTFNKENTSALTGNFEYNRFLNILVVYIVDSSFGNGRIQLTYTSKNEGKFKMFTRGDRNSQFGTFKIYKHKKEVENVQHENNEH